MAIDRGRVLLIMLAAVVALAVGETLLARGMKPIGQAAGGWMGQAVAALGSGWVWAGAALMVLHLGLYMAALSRADLSYVLPLTAASYPLAAILARVFLHEAVGPARWVGTLLIAAGVAAVGFGEAAAGR